MKNLKLIILGLAASAAITTVAQGAPRSAYFMDGYTYRHELNPAFMGEYTYFSIPGIGNLDIDLFSNMGLSNFLFTTPAGSPYKLTTFMSPTVNADDFLGKLNNSNHFNFVLDETIFSLGFKAFGGFNTIGIGVHADAGLALPKSVFEFMKQGQTSADTEYNFKDIKANATGYAEIALGHSRKINSKLGIGAKVKLLIGLANATLHVTDMKLRMGEKEWSVSGEGELFAAAGSGLVVPTYAETGKEFNNPNDATLIDYSKIKYNNFNIGGYGLGFDLGATYQLLPDLQLSLAVNDLGFIYWNDAVRGKMKSEPWTFKGFQDVAINENQAGYEDNKLSTQLDNLWDDVANVVSVHRDGPQTDYTTGLNATLHLGAEYTMPFYRGLSAGFLFTQYIAGVQSWTEGRFYANCKPVKWFDVTVNYGASTYGNDFGWMINFHPRGFNFFIGSDHLTFKVSPQFLPVNNAVASVNIGFNVTL